MNLTIAQKWRRTLAWLRRKFPTQHLITVRSRPMKEDCGTTEYKWDSLFFIRINRNKPFSVRLDTILHEWAHALTWFGAEHTEDHSDEWGLCYAKLYRAWDEWNYGRKKGKTDEP